jgi:RNA polymerase sigma-70 factor (ECF subfamily)
VSDAPGDAAEDAVQEALIRAWRSWRRHGLPERPGAWMATVTRRELARWVTGPHGRVWRATADEDAVTRHADDAADDGDDRLAALALRQALRGLPAQDRLVLLLRYEEGRTQQEIARLLGTPEGTAKVRLHRARGRLREQLAR